jgi:hypothetical protein
MSNAGVIIILDFKLCYRDIVKKTQKTAWYGTKTDM